jgi:hypothetical protein
MKRSLLALLLLAFFCSTAALASAPADPAPVAGDPLGGGGGGNGSGSGG